MGWGWLFRVGFVGFGVFFLGLYDVGVVIYIHAGLCSGDELIGNI